MYEDLVGMRNGKWIVLSHERRTPRKNAGYVNFWKCKCDCGEIKIISSKWFKNSRSISCKCDKENFYDLKGEYGIGYSKNGKFYFDLEDYEKIKKYNWIVSNGYVQSRKVLMHRLIMNCPDDKVVDHINHIRKDNRKSNLRICTQVENMKNCKKPNDKKYTSKYKGVSWNEYYKKWVANIKNDHITHHLGKFDCEIEAARAYNLAAKKYHKEFANLNDL